MNNITHTRKKCILFWIITAAAIVLTVSFLILFQSQVAEPVLPETPRPQTAFDVPIYEALIPAGSSGRPGTHREISYVVIHETANTARGANAKSHAEYLLSGQSGATSWHYTVDERRIYHHIPDEEIAYHSGSAEGNRHGIGVELCVNEDGIFEQTLDNAARLTASLLIRYRLDPSAIYQHADFAKKNCPRIIRNEGRWEDFLGAVHQYYSQANK